MVAATNTYITCICSYILYGDKCVSGATNYSHEWWIIFFCAPNKRTHTWHNFIINVLLNFKLTKNWNGSYPTLFQLDQLVDSQVEVGLFVGQPGWKQLLIFTWLGKLKEPIEWKKIHGFVYVWIPQNLCVLAWWVPHFICGASWWKCICTTVQSTYYNFTRS